jgi:hypothetical protein
MIVQEARAYAERNATSINSLIRNYLAEVAGAETAENALAEEFAQLVKRRGVKRSRPYRFRRADAYDGEV